LTYAQKVAVIPNFIHNSPLPYNLTPPRLSVKKRAFIARNAKKALFFLKILSRSALAIHTHNNGANSKTTLAQILQAITGKRRRRTKKHPGRAEVFFTKTMCAFSSRASSWSSSLLPSYAFLLALFYFLLIYWVIDHPNDFPERIILFRSKKYLTTTIAN